MRVAIVHYWLLEMRGGEKVVEALCKLYPGADLFTLFYSPDGVSEEIRQHKVTASFLNPLRRFHRSLLPVMPLALESLDLRGYDLVISSESGPAKGVLVPASSRHVCYCHSPMRYLWELYPDYFWDWTSRWKRPFLAPLAHYLRVWDTTTAARVDQFVANSENVRGRIRRAWGRDAVVVYPPVPVERFYWKPSEDYYLLVSKLVAYKRIDLAVRAFSRAGRKLKIVGDGPEWNKLKRLAGPSIEFRGAVPDHDLAELYARCRAFVLPGEEDFGMSVVEAMASGKPVIALRKGGVLEIAGEGPAATFFDSPDPDALREAITRFEQREPAIDPAALQASVRRFSGDEFSRRMKSIIEPA